VSGAAQAPPLTPHLSVEKDVERPGGPPEAGLEAGHDVGAGSRRTRRPANERVHRSIRESKQRRTGKIDKMWHRSEIYRVTLDTLVSGYPLKESPHTPCLELRFRPPRRLAMVWCQSNGAS
jgi:hypothetical protein